MRLTGIRAAAAACLAAALAVPAAAQVQFRVNLQLDASEWMLLDRSGDDRVAVLEYVPVGESGESWTRFVLVQLFREDAVPFPGADEALAECRRYLVARCPGAEWTVLRASGDERLYEWKVEACDLELDQHEVGRLFRRHGVWARVSFTVAGEMESRTREQWIRRLTALRIVAVEP